MKLKKDDIKIKESFQLNANKFIEKIEILKTEVNLYFDKAKDEEYSVYIISENTYKKATNGQKVDISECECIGNMSEKDDAISWIVDMQNKHKVFGKKISDKGGEAVIIFSVVLLIGLILTTVGGWKVIHNKQVLDRKCTVEGTITDISTNRLMGKRYASGYYDVYVNYYVNEKEYEGYYGSTSNQYSIGDKINVSYDSKNPDKIIIEEDMKQYSFLFLYLGIIVTVVGMTLLISEFHYRKFN